MCGERILLSYKDDMVVQIVRPATVCGFSPTMRNDVSVNMLTMLALMNKTHHGVRRRPDPAQYSHGRHHRSLPVPARSPRAHRYLQCRLRKYFDPGHRQAGGQARRRRNRGDAVRTIRAPTASIPIAFWRPAFGRRRTVEDAIKELVGLYRQGAWKDDPSFHRMSWMQKEVV